MCEKCGNPDCDGLDLNNISIQNTSKFIDELRYLCTFAIKGKVHPVLTSITSIFLAVIKENVATENTEELKEFYKMCYEFADKRRKKLGIVD